MKVQEYNLTGNEKFSIWYTTMMMMTEDQLDHDSKARILKMAKIMCVGECLDMQKLENEDPAEMEKSKEKQKEFEMMKDAMWKEMDNIQEVLSACYGEPRKGEKHHRCKHND